MGYGGTFNVRDLTSGAPGICCGKVVWSFEELVESQKLLVIRAGRMVILGGLQEVMVRNGVEYVLLHAVSQSGVYIFNKLFPVRFPMTRSF